MNSSNLAETGFIQWCPLKTISISNLPTKKSSVFVIIDQSLSGKAPSDIIYIGRTKNPTQRILGGYLAGYGGKNTRKISQKLLDGGYLEKVAISLCPTEKPRVLQRSLLAKFAEEQGDYPSWNAKKKLQKKTKTKLSDKTRLENKTKTAEKAKTVLAPKPLGKATVIAKSVSSKAAVADKTMPPVEKAKPAIKAATETASPDKSKTTTPATSP
jgi:hypothetical protein